MKAPVKKTRKQVEDEKTRKMMEDILKKYPNTFKKLAHE